MANATNEYVKLCVKDKNWTGVDHIHRKSGGVSKAYIQKMRTKWNLKNPKKQPLKRGPRNKTAKVKESIKKALNFRVTPKSLDYGDPNSPFLVTLSTRNNPPQAKL